MDLGASTAELPVELIRLVAPATGKDQVAEVTARARAIDTRPAELFKHVCIQHLRPEVGVVAGSVVPAEDVLECRQAVVLCVCRCERVGCANAAREYERVLVRRRIE